MRYQLCPKCNGQGAISKPPWVAGDVNEWTSSSCSFTCDVCNGQKIILVPDFDEELKPYDLNELGGHIQNRDNEYSPYDLNYRQ